MKSKRREYLYSLAPVFMGFAIAKALYVYSLLAKLDSGVHTVKKTFSGNAASHNSLEYINELTITIERAMRNMWYALEFMLISTIFYWLTTRASRDVEAAQYIVTKSSGIIDKLSAPA